MDRLQRLTRFSQNGYFGDFCHVLVDGLLFGRRDCAALPLLIVTDPKMGKFTAKRFRKSNSQGSRPKKTESPAKALAAYSARQKTAVATVLIQAL